VFRDESGGTYLNVCGYDEFVAFMRLQLSYILVTVTSIHQLGCSK